MPQDVLKLIPWPNVMGIEKDIESSSPHQIVQLNCSVSRLGTAVTHEDSTLCTKKSQ